MLTCISVPSLHMYMLSTSYMLGIFLGTMDRDTFPLWGACILEWAIRNDVLLGSRNCHEDWRHEEVENDGGRISVLDGEQSWLRRWHLISDQICVRLGAGVWAVGVEIHLTARCVLVPMCGRYGIGQATWAGCHSEAVSAMTHFPVSF